MKKSKASLSRAEKRTTAYLKSMLLRQIEDVSHDDLRYWVYELVRNGMAFYAQGIVDPNTVVFRVADLAMDRSCRLLSMNPKPDSTEIQYAVTPSKTDVNEYFISAHFAPNSIQSAHQTTTIGALRNMTGCILKFLEEPMQHICKLNKS